MSEYCTKDGSDIRSITSSSGVKWDDIDVESSKKVTLFVDISSSDTLSLHTTDNHGNYYEVDTFSLDSGTNALILTGNYPELTFSLSTSGNTITSFYEVG